jgi:hypothetical protein
MCWQLKVNPQEAEKSREVERKVQLKVVQITCFQQFIALIRKQKELSTMENC